MLYYRELSPILTSSISRLAATHLVTLLSAGMHERAKAAATADSWGLQAGGQSNGCAVFLMTDKAVRYVHRSHGWEIGVGPTMVVNEGVAKTYRPRP